MPKINKKEEIKALLAQVNLYEICQELGVSRITIYRTLEGSVKSTRKSIKDLKAVVQRAKEEKAKMDEALSDLDNELSTM